MARAPLALVIILGLAAQLGCASTAGGASSQPQTYTEVVEARFRAAEVDFEAGRFLDAVPKYNALATQFPYSSYAALSRLRVGDAYFEQAQYASAVEQYRAFMQLHPRHERRPYAHFRVALSFYELMPDDWFFAPPAYERDLSKSRDAAREMGIFVRTYPDSEFVERGQRLLAQTRRRLADHELYVARFYMKRENFKASSMRLTYLLKNYQGLGLDAQALFLLAQSYLALGERDRARDALADLLTVHPESPDAKRARDWMGEYQLTIEAE